MGALDDIAEEAKRIQYCQYEMQMKQAEEEQEKQLKCKERALKVFVDVRSLSIQFIVSDIFEVIVMFI